MLRVSWTLLFLLISLIFVLPANAQEFSFEQDSNHYVVVVQVFFDGIVPVVGHSLGVYVIFKPLPSAYWNNSITVLNFSVTHYRLTQNSSALFMDFNESITLDTGSGSMWKYTTPPCAAHCTPSDGNSPPTWYFTPKDSGTYRIDSVIKLVQPSFPAETHDFSFDVSPQSVALTATTATTTTSTLTLTQTASPFESSAYMVAFVVLGIVLAGAVIVFTVKARGHKAWRPQSSSDLIQYPT